MTSGQHVPFSLQDWCASSPSHHDQGPRVTGAAIHGTMLERIRPTREGQQLYSTFLSIGKVEYVEFVRTFEWTQWGGRNKQVQRTCSRWIRKAEDVLGEATSARQPALTMIDGLRSTVAVPPIKTYSVQQEVEEEFQASRASID